MALKVGFIGLGTIGKRMAGNIARAGFDLMAYDLRAEPLRELAAKAYDRVVRPAMTEDGTVDEEAQKKAVEQVLRRLDVKDPPPLNRIFDFSRARKVVAEMQAQGWKPRP